MGSDCFSTILQEEGIPGLFKGFGAVILQYTVHFLIIKFSSKIISQVAQVFSNPAMDPRLVGYTDQPTPGGTPSLESGPPAATPPITDSPRKSPSRRQSPLRTVRETSGSQVTRSNPQTPSLGTPVAAAGLPPLFSNTNSPRRKINMDDEFNLGNLRGGAGSGISKSWRSFDKL